MCLACIHVANWALRIDPCPSSGPQWEKRSPTTGHVDLAGCNMPVSDSRLTLGITLIDNTTSFDSHVSQLCKQSFFHIQQLRRIRHCLTVDRANAADVATVQSRLSYLVLF
jgi:hypothetical protein